MNFDHFDKDLFLTLLPFGNSTYLLLNKAISNQKLVLLM